MYELIFLNEHDGYFDCPAKIGLVRLNDTDVLLIDSGNDKEAGKKIFRVLEANGWTLKMILNTHSHADHIGGNRFLQEKTGCKIYAAGMESAFTNYPILEPLGLYGGLPFKDLTHKFLKAQESSAEPLTSDILPEEMKLLSLPGHSFEMTGFLTKDRTAYVGDVVSSVETLSKYGLGYLYDPKTSLATLEQLKGMEARHFVPSHAPVCESLDALIDENIRSIEGVFSTILTLCREPITAEALLKRVFDAYSLTISAAQYALIGSTVRSYLSSLLTDGRITFECRDNELLWKSI